MGTHAKVLNAIKGRVGTHSCPSCKAPTYCAVEAGKSGSLCWCMSVEKSPTAPTAIDGDQCLCRKCLTEES